MFRVVAALLVPQCLIASKSVVNTDNDVHPHLFNGSEEYPSYLGFADDNPSNGDVFLECRDDLFDDLSDIFFDDLPAYTDGQIFDVHEAVVELEKTSPPTEPEAPAAKSDDGKRKLGQGSEKTSLLTAPAAKTSSGRKRKREEPEREILLPDAVFVDGIRITDGRKDANYRLAVAVLNSNYNRINGLLITKKWGVDPNTYIYPGKRTMLMIAASNNNLHIVQLLLKWGANPQLQDDEGRTALDLTTDEDVKQLLSPSSATGSYAAAVPPAVRFNANYQLALAVLGNNIGKANVLFDTCPYVDPNSYRDVEQKTLLMVAALNNNADMVQLLLVGRADPFLVNSQGQTALALATEPKSVVKQILSCSMMSFGSPIPVKRPRTQ